MDSNSPIQKVTRINEYQQLAGRTDLITEHQFKQNHYYILGMAGEASELLEKAAAAASPLSETISPDAARAIAYEAGDVAWYAVREIHAIEGNPMRADYLVDDIQLQWYDPIAIDPIVLLRAAINISILAGKNADITKKMVRDNHNIFTTEVASQIRDNCYLVLQELARVASSLNMLYSDMLTLNVEKLSSRLIRNQIHGSGDNR